MFLLTASLSPKLWAETKPDTGRNIIKKTGSGPIDDVYDSICLPVLIDRNDLCPGERLFLFVTLHVPPIFYMGNLDPSGLCSDTIVVDEHTPDSTILWIKFPLAMQDNYRAVALWQGEERETVIIVKFMRDKTSVDCGKENTVWYKPGSMVFFREGKKPRVVHFD
jgi:hypothetical protein